MSFVPESECKGTDFFQTGKGLGHFFSKGGDFKGFTRKIEQGRAKYDTNERTERMKESAKA